MTKRLIEAANQLVEATKEETKRREILEVSLKYIEAARSQDDTRETQVAVAEMYQSLGRCRMDLLDTESALQSFQTAVGIFDRLREREHKDLALQIQYGKAMWEVARCYLTKRDYQRGVETFEKLITHYEKLSIRHPRNLALKVKLANSLVNVNSCLSHMNKPMVYIERASRLHEELIKAEPNNLSFLSEKSLFLEMLFAYELSKKGDKASMQAIDEAIAIREKILRKNPKDMSNQQYIIRCRLVKSSHCITTKQYELALRETERSETLAVDLLSRRKDLPTHRRLHGSTLMALGNVLLLKKDLDAAYAKLTQALEIFESLDQKIVETKPSTELLAKAHWLISCYHREIGNSAKEYAHLNLALKNRPEYRAAMLRLAELAVNNPKATAQELKEAKRLAETANKLFRRDPVGLRILGAIRFRCGEIDGSIRAYVTIQKQQPKGNASATFAIFLCRLAKSHYDKAYLDLISIKKPLAKS